MEFPSGVRASVLKMVSLGGLCGLQSKYKRKSTRSPYLRWLENANKFLSGAMCTIFEMNLRDFLQVILQFVASSDFFLSLGLFNNHKL